jgi:hypothetical protein
MAENTMSAEANQADGSLVVTAKLGGLWHSLSLQIRREKGKLTARRNRLDRKGCQPEIVEAGYVCFVMNDTSKLRIRHFSITPADPIAHRKLVSDILIE